jgi:sugar-specific transcriptional regulator TrmB
MEATEKALTELGLTSTEARLYLAGLGLENVTISELTKKTRIKRPTVYHAIDTLRAKGLVADHRTGSKLTYEMCPPESLRDLVEKQKAQVDSRAVELEKLIPLLIEHKPKKDDEFSVVHYSGIEGMKMVMDIAFYCRGKYWDVIAPYENFLREYDPEYAKRYLQARKYYGITSRALWEPRFMENNRQLSKEEQRDRNPRFMPATMRDRFKSMIFIFDDKVAIFSSYEKLSAVLITSKEMKNMFQAMYDTLWEISVPYDEAINAQD